MRNVLDKLDIQTDTHAGLAHDVYAPVKVSGTEDERKKLERRLRGIVALKTPEGYREAFRRWEAALGRMKAFSFRGRARSRLLVGTGYPSATEVGLTFHRTWGVPVIPGSSLKGLVAAYVQATYGPAPGEVDPEREPFRGVQGDGRRMERGPGDVYRRIFGAPATDDGGSAQRGGVIFHDALWSPDGPPKPFGLDVLTVHHGSYYRQQTPPNDYESPTPVSFLTVRPGSEFLVAWSVPEGEEELAERVGKYIEEALGAWGIGAKTAAGYGRLTRVASSGGEAKARAADAEPEVVARLGALLDKTKEGKPQREVLAEIERDLLDPLRSAPEVWRGRLVRRIEKILKSPRLVDDVKALSKRILGS
ncbi:MAG TPA: type III-B CRISPR module RAMP protein Cmr6 [Polyangium sp.]|nr:type III-B CRISPR module RAMP protein Cmr6 [Polyangium sp.]